MGIKLVVFDMAGTTVEDDQHVAGALQHAMSHYGFESTLEDINQVMGYSKPVAIQQLLMKYGAGKNDSTELLTKIHDRFVNEMISFYQNNEYIREKQDVRLVFGILRNQGIKVAIDTGFSRAIADTIFQRLGWVQGIHFDVSITSDEVENGRPYPDMIYRAMQLCGISDASEVIKVGDTASDLQQGTAAGCRYVVGVTTGAYTSEELSREQHTHLIADLKELLDLPGIEHPAYLNQE